MDSSALLLQVGVKALLKNSEGKYLLVRRNPKKYPDMQAVWDIVGGRIDTDFKLFENLQREIKEEVNLELVCEPKLVAAQDIILPNKHVVRLTYIGEIEGDPQVDEDNTEARWFTSREIYNFGNGELDTYFKELLDTKRISI